MERYVYVMNSDKYSNANVDYSFGNKGNAFAANLAFKNTSVNPVIKCTNINAEHNGISANFFEIRSAPHTGRISNDSNTAIVNRVFPSNNSNDIGYYGTNKQQTASFKIRTHSTTSPDQTSEFSNQLLIGNTSINMDLDSYDYFVLINPEIAHGSTDKHPASRPHFAKITDIISFDEYGDGFEFEPKYPEALKRNINFEIYKGPAVNDTDVVAVSYGLRGDGNEIGTSTSDDINFDFITDKYDGSNEVSRPTWYFYNDRLQYNDQLDYNTKYNLTTCRWFSDFTVVGNNVTASLSSYQSGVATISQSQAESIWEVGISVFRNDTKAWIGNIASFDDSDEFTLDYVRSSMPSSAVALSKGRTIHQSIFRTEREFGTTINDYGTLNQDAVLVDNMYIKDDAVTDYETNNTYAFNPAMWKYSFRNYKRNVYDRASTHSLYSSAGASSIIHAYLTGPKRYLHYKSAHKKNNAINPIMEASVNNPKNKISQLASTKVLDNNGIQFMKIKENAKYVVTNSIHTTTNKEIKLPYSAKSFYHSVGPSFRIILINLYETTSDDWKANLDYGLNDVIKPDSIIRIKDTYYRVSLVSDTDNDNKEQTLIVTHKKDIKDKTWFTLSNSSHLDNFASEDVYIMPFNGGLNTNCTIDTEAIYEKISGTPTIQRLTMNENTISIKDNSLYKKKLVLLNRDFYGYDIDINYGDKTHSHVKLLTTKQLYQLNPIHYMYYYSGNYCIEKNVFTGLVEDIESKNQDNLITYTIHGRDNTSVLLNGTTNKNLNRTNDIIYSTLAPVFDTSTVLTKVSMNDNVLTVSGLHAVKKYDLILNANGELIGEISSADGMSNTEITLVARTDNPTNTSTFIWVKLSDSNYLTGAKALTANTKETIHPTDFSSVGSNGLIFNDGEKITYPSSSFSFSKLLNTSATGSYDIDNTIGYDITNIKDIEENLDSSFALKLSRENKASIQYNNIHTVSSMYFNVLDTITSNTENTSIRLAPTFPVVLGSIDKNTSDINGYGADMRYLYMVNSNIPSGGFIHTLKEDASTYYTPKNTFRYWGLQEFKEGSIKETYNTIYDSGKKAQRITAAMPMYKINAQGSKLTPSAGDLTAKLAPLSGSNIWSGTDLGLTGNRLAPVQYFGANIPINTTWSQLENIDYRCKNYELLVTGDIYPDSKLRWNNLIFNSKDFNNYGIVLKNKGSDGSTVNHENFTGTNTQTNYRDSNYERIEITSSNRTTDQLKRFGIMRLVEATFDWHMNPIDYESVPDDDTYDKIEAFEYPRMKLIDGTNSVTVNASVSGNATLANAVTFAIGDIVFRDDGIIFAVISSSTGTSSTTTIHVNDKKQQDASNLFTGNVTIMRQELFRLYADPDWGINTFYDNYNPTGIQNNFRMLYNYLIVPGISRDYFRYSLLEYDRLVGDDEEFDAQNIFIPIISKLNGTGSGGGGTDFDDYYSLFHQAKHWDSGTSEPIWYHPSKIINALAYPTTRDTSPETNLVEDGLQYKISNSSPLYGVSTILFKGMQTSTNNNEGSFEYPTSSILGHGTHGTLTKWKDYATEITGPYLDQRALNVNMQDYGSATSRYALCGPKTTKHIYSEDGDRSWSRKHRHHVNFTGGSITKDDSGQLFQAQTFIKPRIILSTDTDYGKNITGSNGLTLDDNGKNNWLDFVPNLKGYYLVSEKIEVTSGLNTTEKYLPSQYHSTNVASKGRPVYIGKITEHYTDTNGDYTRHNIKLDKDLDTEDTSYTFRLMRISETTFEDTPNYFEVNEMFDTGLKYDALMQNFTTAKKDEKGGQETDTDFLAYQEGLYAMYLLLDVDTFNTYIDRRTIDDVRALFVDGQSINCCITDGNTTTEKSLNVSIGTTNAKRLKFSYDGNLTGFGVVSFGEIFNIESTGTPDNTKATNAYIGTTLSIGTDAEQAMVDILEESGIKVDNTIRNITYTGNIVDVDTTGTSIALTTSHSNVALGDIIYNQSGRLIGKVTTASAGSSLSVSNIFYKPKKNDELTKYDRKPFILNTNFNEQDVFTSLNYLGAKQQLDYKFSGDNIQIKNMEDFSSKRRFTLKYKDSSNLISVDSNKSLFDKANKIVVIGDNVKAEVEIPSKVKRTIKHLDANIKNTEEARIKAHSLLNIHRMDYKKITLTMEKTGFELMEAGDIIHLDFPNHNIPADDYIIFEIENMMSTVATVTVGTFNKSIAERLSEIKLQQNKGFTTLFTRNINKSLTGKVLIDDLLPKEKTLHYALTTTTGGTLLGFD
tara:strand:+ start:6410 stop:13129 length:6720 start_codon:yes stop_codon:yes gene_type:complete